MKRKKSISLCAIILSLAFLSGCWSSNEINTLAFVMGISVDRAQEEDAENAYKVTVQIAQPNMLNSSGDGEGSSGKAYVNLSAQGIGVQMPLNQIATQLNRKLYTAHNQAIVISREVAEQNILSVLDFFIRGSDGRYSINLFIADGSANDVLSADCNLQDFPAMYLRELIESGVGYWRVSESTIANFLSEMLSKTRAAIIPMVGTMEDENGEICIDFGGGAVFDGTKMCTTLTPEQMRAVIMVAGDMQKGYFEIDAYDQYVVLNITNSTSTVTPIYENGTFRIQVDLDLGCSIRDIAANIDVLSEKVRGEMEQIADATTLKLLEDTLTYAKSYNVDIFGFGELIHQQHPKESADLIDHWDEEFKNLEITFNVTTEILSTGAIMHPLDPDYH